MNEPQQKDPPFTFPHLSHLIDLLIGDDEKVILPSKYTYVAELLEIKAKNTFTCAVQWESETGEKLLNPVIWRYQRWVDSTERWKRQKERSEQERIARFIFAANVKIVAAACVKTLLMEDKWAESTAFAAMTKGKMKLINWLGINKLIEREDEL